MTPLAHRIVKELTLPKAKRTFIDPVGLLKRMDDIHCFEVTAVRDLAANLWLFDPQEDPEALAHFQDMTADAFLPAPKTWIEFEADGANGGGRNGMLLIEAPDKKSATVVMAGVTDTAFCSLPIVGRLHFSAHGAYERIPATGHDSLWPLAEAMITGAAPFLSFINSPQIIGRKAHAPHRGLERALLSKQRAVGKFPLHAWTEIFLEVSPPHDASGEAPAESRLTGMKALHWCRQHRRTLASGERVLVRSHWRGDAALGMKQSRYVVVMPDA